MPGLIATLFERRAAEISLGQLDRWIDDWFSGGPATATGRRVSESQSLQCLTVFAWVRILAETISSLPLFIYRRLEGSGKDRDPTHPLYRLLNLQPNPEMTSMAWREALVGHRALWGNAYSFIERDNGGRAKALGEEPTSLTAFGTAITRHGRGRW